MTVVFKSADLLPKRPLLFLINGQSLVHMRCFTSKVLFLMPGRGKKHPTSSSRFCSVTMNPAKFLASFLELFPPYKAVFSFLPHSIFILLLRGPVRTFPKYSADVLPPFPSRSRRGNTVPRKHGLLFLKVLS